MNYSEQLYAKKSDKYNKEIFRYKLQKLTQGK